MAYRKGENLPNRTRSIVSGDDATERVRFGATGVEVFSEFCLSVPAARI